MVKLLSIALFLVCPFAIGEDVKNGEIRIVNNSGVPISVTMLHRTGVAEKWLDNRVITDIPIRVDENDRVVVIRQATNANDNKLSIPVRVMVTCVINPKDAGSGCIHLYLHRDKEDALRADLVCLGPGKWIAYDSSDRSKESLEIADLKLLKVMRECKSIDVNSPSREQF